MRDRDLRPEKATLVHFAVSDGASIYEPTYGSAGRIWSLAAAATEPQ